MKSKIFAALLLMTASLTANAFVAGTTPGPLLGDTATQQQCTQHGTQTAPLTPNGNVNWRNGGLNRAIDDTYYKQDIIAYKIRFFNGQWSDWYVKGVNDIYNFTTQNVTNSALVDLRLAWIYFYDHDYLYIGCVG